MRLEKLEIRNFRCFEQFELELAGESLLLVGANAAGKSSLLRAISMAMQGGPVRQSDFRDLLVPVELIATISGIPPAAQGSFADATDFSTMPPTLRIGVRGTWDPDEREIESVHGFPDDAWHRASRLARSHLPIVYLPSQRDPERLARVIGRDSLLEELILGLELDEELEQAVTSIASAGQQLARVAPVESLLGELSGALAGFLANVNAQAYSLGLHATQPRDVLGQLELMLTHAGPQGPTGQQSGGLAHGTVFALALALLDRRPGALALIDEPECALHPQAQRALVGALRGHAAQSLISTHSAAVLDRSDPRLVLRLRRHATGDTTAVRASGMTDQEAKRLSRYSTSLTAEAFFAETAILVEGFSDLLAVRVLAGRIGVDLDGSGVSLISLEGETLFKHYLQLLGPGGLSVTLRGLCDLDAEAGWISRLNSAGLAVTDRSSLNAAGFQVCEPDLEAELLEPLIDTDVESAFDSDDGAGQYAAFTERTENQGKTSREMQLAFVKAEKIRWAPVLAAHVPVEHIPAPINSILSSL